MVNDAGAIKYPTATNWSFLPPLPPSDQRARDAAFLREVWLIHPKVISRRKQLALRVTLGWTRKEVQDTARDLCISLGTFYSHAEMAAPPPELRLHINLPLALRRLRAGWTMEETSNAAGCCPKALQRIMRGAGIESRHDIRWADGEVADAILALREGPGFGNLGVTLTQGARASGSRPRVSGIVFPLPDPPPGPPV